MDKSELEALLARIDVWLLIFGVIVVIGVAGESVFGIRHWWNSRKLSKLQNEESEVRQGEIVRLQEQTAAALKSAAEANRVAEEERLARVKIEERLASRRIGKGEHDSIVAVLKPHAGAIVEFTKIGDMEAAAFAEDLLKTLKDAGWGVRLSIAGMVLPPPYGVKCWVNENLPAGKALAEAVRKLPNATIESNPDLPAVGRILVGLKPPA